MPVRFTDLLTVAGGGASGFIASTINAAIQLTTRLTAGLSSVAPGFSIDTSRQTFLAPTQIPAVDIDVQGVTGTLARVTHTPAIDTDIHATLIGASTVEIPACDIVQVVYSLTRRVGGNASANVTGTWTNLANAQGIHDGSDATSAGAGRAGSCGSITPITSTRPI